MEFRLKKATDIIVFYYPVLYLFLALLSNDIARKISLIMILMLILNIVYSRNKSQVFLLLIVFGLIFYNAFVFGLNYVVHQDFYGYVLILLICINYSSKRNFLNFNSLFTYKNIMISISLFSVIVVVSILFGNGLQRSTEWGTSMPLLYGPYELPHSLSYQLIAMFMYASIGYHKYNNFYFIIFMLSFSGMLVWTGVRSSFLVFAFVLLFEYFNIKKISIKSVIILSGLFVSLYLLLFTNFFQNNPIIQKTIKALSQTSGITNGRTDFNNYLTNVYLNKLNIMEKVFGIGIEKLRHYMSLRYATALHAHNDVFNTLLGMGLIGFMIYIFLLIKFCMLNTKWFKTFIPIFLLAFANGLFMYTAFTPCLPVFLVYFQQLESKRAKIIYE